MQRDRLFCIARAAAGSLVFLLAGCNVYRSTSLDAYTQTTNPRFCKTTAGAYALPKGELVMRIERKAVGAGGAYHFELAEGASAQDGTLIAFTGDANHRYCLDFLANGFYADAIGVTRDDAQLLERVYSNAEDKAKGVIEAVVEGAGTAIAAAGGGRSFGAEANGSQDVVQLRFDPFDDDLITQINDAIRYTGHCIYIEPDGDPHVPFWMRNQCASRKVYRPAHGKDDPDDVLDTSAFVAGAGRFGIFYKPVLSHTLVILKKDDPTSNQPWRVWKRKVIELPNRAPPFMIEVRRGLFTDRKTDIAFQSGMLQSVTVDKKSELNAVADVLVRIAQVAVQIPAKALIISTNEAKNREALIKTNQTLIQTLNALKTAQDDYAARVAGLTQEQREALDGAGRSSGFSARSFEICIQSVALASLEEAERVCRDLQEQTQ